MATTHHNAHGSEIEGTRITVYTLLPHFLDSSTTEAYICQLYNLSPQQVAAARAYVLNNADVVLGEHLQIEARRSAGNPPQVVEAAHKTREKLLQFKAWLHEQEVARSTQAPTASSQTGGLAKGEGLRTFKQWLQEHESGPGEGS